MRNIVRARVQRLIKGTPYKNTRIWVFLVVFTTLGVGLIVFSRAASNTASVEPESSASSTAVIVGSDDPATSGGKYIKFGAGSSSGTLNVTLSPGLISDSTELVNANRGFHQWRGQPASVTQPAPYPLDGYERYYWSDFETSQGVYNFSKLTTAIDTFTNPAKNGGLQGRRFSFRVRAMSDGSDGSLRVPQYMQSCTTYYATKNVYVPNWNQACFQDRLSALFTAMEATLQPYKAKINFVDIGMYGQWGEWSLYQYPAQYTASSASLNFIIDQHVKHLGWAQLLLFVVAGDAQVNYAMAMQPGTTAGLSKPIGIRSDCYDCQDFLSAHDKLGVGRPTALLDRWKTAPLIGERGSVSGTNGQVALSSVTTYHISSIANDVVAANRTASELALYQQAGLAAGYRLKISQVKLGGTSSQPVISLSWLNSGSAPPYDPWNVELWIESASGVAKGSAVALLPNASLLPGQAHTQTFKPSVPGGLGSGSYTVKVRVKDPANYLLPMQLPLSVGDSSAGYMLGSFQL